MARFTDKTVVVTGATDGIGRAVADLLGSEDARLVLVGRDASRGAELEAELGADRSCFVAGDVRTRDTAERAVAAARERFGGLDALVNNAGIDHTGSIEETPHAEVREVFDVNFFGALHFMQVAAPAMFDRGGAIVNVTSRLASIGVPTMSLYAASKGALLALTRGAAVEWAPRGVRVNAVAPGLTATPLAERWIDEQPDPAAWRRGLEDSIPQGRLGEPRDVAAAIAFLACDDAAHITGASLPVDGGYTAA